MVYYDYIFKFKKTNLALALTGMSALQTAGLIPVGTLPQNMLGDPRDISGNIDAVNPAWLGRPGSPLSTFTDEYGTTITTPAKGDPNYYYIAIRGNINPTTLPINPTDFGLAYCDPAENASVLGVWAQTVILPQNPVANTIPII